MEDKKLCLYHKNSNTVFSISYEELAKKIIKKDTFLMDEKTVRFNSNIFTINEEDDPNFLETLKEYIEYNQDYIMIYYNYDDYSRINNNLKFIHFSELEENLLVFVKNLKSKLGNNNIYHYYKFGLSKFGYGIYNISQEFVGIFSSDKRIIPVLKKLIDNFEKINLENTQKKLKKELEKTQKKLKEIKENQ